METPQADPTEDVPITLATDDLPTNGEELPLTDEARKDSWPPSIKFIIAQEGCERFGYYGLKAVLLTYFTKYLKFDDEPAVTAVHAFIFGAYATAVLGAIIADGFLGKYRTILYLSLVYCAGSAMLALTAMPEILPGNPPPWWGAGVALILIALGTGGIKSSVSAFVGDQFLPGQDHLLQTVFALFYWIINLGSLFSTILTPILRTISFALAFGVPAILILLATLVFFLGRNRFRKIPPGQNVFALAFRVIVAAFRGWRRRSSAGASIADEKKPESFWDYAKAEVEHGAVEDLKAVFRVLFVFLPLPLFWALFDQHSTRWVLQAETMDRNIFGLFTLLPELVQVLNPGILIWLIWIFDRLIYPFINRRGWSLKPLKRMSIGMGLTALAFVASGLLEILIQANPTHSISVFLIIPQFFILCCGEIMVSITGLEFAYTQAPKTMKSLLMAGWLLPVSIGNLIVTLVAQFNFGDKALEFFFFAALMAFFTGIFVLIIQFYVYREDTDQAKKESPATDHPDSVEQSKADAAARESDQVSLLAAAGISEADMSRKRPSTTERARARALQTPRARSNREISGTSLRREC